MFIWYAPSPNIWIRCTELHATIAGMTVTLHDGREIGGLRKRQINGATIVQ
jgi:hypothetical protein